MRKLIIACLLGMSCLTAGAVPVHAQSMRITTDDSYGYRHQHRYYPITAIAITKTAIATGTAIVTAAA